MADSIHAAAQSEAEAAQAVDPKAQPPVLSTSIDQSTEQGAGTEDAPQDVPYATIGDRTFASQEELSEWWDKEGNPGAQPKDAAEGDPDGAETEDEAPIDPERPWFKPDTRSDEEIAASLKERGGVYAHEAYLPAALEFQKTGDVSEETLARTAEGMGIPVEFARTFVDAQIAAAQGAHAASALKAQVDKAAPVVTKEEQAEADAIRAVVGTRADYDAFGKWATEGGLSAKELEGYMAALDSRNVETAKALLTTYSARFKASGKGGAPRDLSGEAAVANRSAPPKQFESQAEQDAAINDPRYRTSESYRKAVQARLRDNG